MRRKNHRVSGFRLLYRRNSETFETEFSGSILVLRSTGQRDALTKASLPISESILDIRHIPVICLSGTAEEQEEHVTSFLEREPAFVGAFLLYTPSVPWSLDQGTLLLTSKNLLKGPPVLTKCPEVVSGNERWLGDGRLVINQKTVLYDCLKVRPQDVEIVPGPEKLAQAICDNKIHHRLVYVFRQVVKQLVAYNWFLPLPERRTNPQIIELARSALVRLFEEKHIQKVAEIPDVFLFRACDVVPGFQSSVLYERHRIPPPEIAGFPRLPPPHLFHTKQAESAPRMIYPGVQQQSNQCWFLNWFASEEEAALAHKTSLESAREDLLVFEKMMSEYPHMRDHFESLYHYMNNLLQQPVFLYLPKTLNRRMANYFHEKNILLFLQQIEEEWAYTHRLYEEHSEELHVNLNYGGRVDNIHDYWVIRPDGALRKPDQEQGIHGKLWRVVAPDELAIRWKFKNKGHRYLIHKLPANSPTPEQIRCVREIEKKVAETALAHKNLLGYVDMILPHPSQGWHL